MSDDEFFPTTAVGTSLSKFGGWMRDRVSSLATEISTALLEDLPEFREQLERDCRLSGDIDYFQTLATRSPPIASPLIEKLINESTTYSDDPSDLDDFCQFQYTAEDVRDIRIVYPTVARHVDSTSSDFEELVWKRLLYKVRKIEQEIQQSVVLSEEYDAAEDMVVVHCSSTSRCSARSQSIFICTMVNVVLSDLSSKNLNLVKLLHNKCFPVDYPESFYKSLSAFSDLVKLGYVADCLVGVVGCKQIEWTLYIMTLGVLEHYRRQGIATNLLLWAINKGREKHLEKIGLHVHVNNEDGINFYRKHGFRIGKTEPEYYPQLTPSAAHYMVRTLDN